MADNNNGKVEQGRREERLDNAVGRLERLADRFDQMCERVDAVEKELAVVKERQGLFTIGITLFNGAFAYIMARVIRP
jgi:predicted nuclease with TOPRIM domain